MKNMSLRYTTKSTAAERQKLMSEQGTTPSPSPSPGSPTSETPAKRDLFIFNVLYLIAQVFGVLAIILTIVWSVKFLDGYSWQVPKSEFNFHPLFMIIGMVFLYGNSILVYRGLRNFEKPILKIVHTIVHALALIISFVGIYAVIDFHNRANIPNFYSIHSWIGITAVILYSLQLVASFYVFLFPGVAGSYRAILLPFHIFGGFFIFGLVMVACISGLTEKVIFTLTAKGYSSLQPPSWYVNFIGVFIILYGAIIAYLASDSKYKRHPLPSELPASSYTPAVTMAETRAE